MNYLSPGGVNVGTLSTYELVFKSRFATEHGDSFQKLFSDIMGRRYPGDFLAVRPWGQEGDRKNDGYVRSTRELFQCYAPLRMEATEAKAKIQEDFLGALKHWKPYFDKWIFVHNALGGLGAPIAAKMLEMDAHHPSVRCVDWGYVEIFKQVEGLGLIDLISIFGHLPN